VARTQAQRRQETREQLLTAARNLVAARGVAGASVDALAEAADRTSGALYAQFGGKEGLLIALLDAWKDAAATVILADYTAHPGIEALLASLWRNFADPPSDGGDAWVLLEHELWLYACRHPEAHDAVADRYEDARRRLGEAAAPNADGPRGPSGVGALLIALVIGLEMQRRLDPASIPDELAIAGLLALLGVGRA
jgi:AcrR family transcriptional regulator